MRILFALFFCVALSSCYKVEDTVICNNSIPQPTLATASYTLNLGNTLTITPTSDTTGLDFFWTDPLDSTFTGAQLNSFIYSTEQTGTWHVYAKNRISGCSSGKTNISVTVNTVNPCNLNGNYFKLGNNPPVTITATSIDSGVNYYRVHFTNNTTYVDVVFHKAPKNNRAYEIVPTMYAGDVHYYQCAVQSHISGYGIVVARPGAVYTYYVGNKLKVVFCGISIIYGTTTLTNCEGNMQEL